MRYRAKFGLLGWIYVALPCWLIVRKVSSLNSGHRNGALGLLFVVLCVVFGFQRVLNHIFIYWEVDSSGLRERCLWNERSIPWQEVTRISGWMPEHPWSDSLALHYARSAPLSDSGTVVAAPEDRQQFLTHLHRYAPKATFDV
jgi:hypothetical protein